MTRKGANPRRANGSRRSKLRRQVAAEGLPCGICHLPIDYSLPPGHPMSYELDEIVPVSKGGSPYERANVQPAHRICNQRKGNRTPPPPGAPLERPMGEVADTPQTRRW